MAISSVGIGSGLDVESIVSQMVDLERRPIKTLEAKAEFIDAKISVQGQISSLVSGLHDSLFDLTLDSTWKSAKASTSGSSVSANITGAAAVGTYNMNVTSLAQSQTVVSAKLGADAKLGAGKLVFSIGHLSPKAQTAVELDGTETLEQAAKKINDAGVGVQASVIKDADGQQQLVLTAKNTGLEGKFSLEVQDAAAGSVLEGWGNYTPGSTVDTVGASGLFQAQLAQNAKMTLNGVQLESSTNTFASALTGVSLSVNSLGSSLLNVTQDTAAIKEKIQKFVDAYNSLNELLTNSTKYTEDTKAAGVFQGDSSVVSMQNAFRLMTQTVVGSAKGAFSRLSDIGIEMANPTSAKVSGALVLNSAKLDTALNDLASMQSLFTAKETAAGQGNGIAVTFRNFTTGLMDLEGALKSKDTALEKELKRNGEEQEKVEKRATSLESRLRAQYTALDVKMASLNSLSSYVEQMVASWNKSSD
ncbi:flagellar filament capping protein FliD [Comamonas jiangduensis]|uniref:flagellar filament capping protein FliD n=2 Tax=Comamonas jiangduensis TaxID=1194168 RepID=UPI0028AB2EAE|nr:flagellar filament capping protein FliD [Comamonas jiangduensis]